MSKVNSGFHSGESCFYASNSMKQCNQSQMQTVIDNYVSCTRVGPKGMQFLNSCTPDHQPPLLLTLTPEMMGDEENKVAVSEAGVINFCTQLDLDKVSQVCSPNYTPLPLN